MTKMTCSVYSKVIRSIPARCPTVTLFATAPGKSTMYTNLRSKISSGRDNPICKRQIYYCICCIKFKTKKFKLKNLARFAPTKCGQILIGQIRLIFCEMYTTASITMLLNKYVSECRKFSVSPFT